MKWLAMFLSVLLILSYFTTNTAIRPVRADTTSSTLNSPFGLALDASGTASPCLNANQCSITINSHSLNDVVLIYAYDNNRTSTLHGERLLTISGTPFAQSTVSDSEGYNWYTAGLQVLETGQFQAATFTTQLVTGTAPVGGNNQKSPEPLTNDVVTFHYLANNDIYLMYMAFSGICINTVACETEPLTVEDGGTLRASANGASTSPTATTSTTVNAYDAIIALFGSNPVQTVGTGSTGFTAGLNFTGSSPAMQYETVSNTGTFTAGWTGQTYTRWGEVIIAIKGQSSQVPSTTILDGNIGIYESPADSGETRPYYVQTTFSNDLLVFWANDILSASRNTLNDSQLYLTTTNYKTNTTTINAGLTWTLIFTTHVYTNATDPTCNQDAVPNEQYLYQVYTARAGPPGIYAVQLHNFDGQHGGVLVAYSGVSAIDPQNGVTWTCGTYVNPPTLTSATVTVNSPPVPAYPVSEIEGYPAFTGTPSMTGTLANGVLDLNMSNATPTVELETLVGEMAQVTNAPVTTTYTISADYSWHLFSFFLDSAGNAANCFLTFVCPPSLAQLPIIGLIILIGSVIFAAVFVIVDVYGERRKRT